MTVDAFLAWRPEDPDAPGKWELVGGVPVFCQSEGGLHARVKQNIGAALDQALPPGGPCIAYIDGPAVRIDEKTAYVPDVAVDCAGSVAGLEYENPVLAVEVAVSTLARDMGEKAKEYFRNPRLQAYLVVDALKREVWLWRRGFEGPERALTVEADLGCGPLRLETAAFWRYLP